MGAPSQKTVSCTFEVHQFALPVASFAGTVYVAVIVFTSQKLSTRHVALAQADKAEHTRVLRQVSLAFPLEPFSFYLVLIDVQSRLARTAASSPFVVKRFRCFVGSKLVAISGDACLRLVSRIARATRLLLVLFADIVAFVSLFAPSSVILMGYTPR